MNSTFELWLTQLRHTTLALLGTVGLGLYLSSWIEAKLGADLQARVGPNRAGASGWLQPLANFLGLLRRRNPVGDQGARNHFWWMQGVPLAAMVALIPVGGSIPLLHAPMAIFFPVFLCLFSSCCAVLVSWQAEQVESRFASIRHAALSVAAVAPALFSIAVAGITARGLSWERILAAQGALPFSWLAFSNPFALIAAVVFLLSGMLLFSLPPFSSGAEPLIGVVAALPGYSGVRETWLRLTHRLGPLCWCLIAVGMFFGGAGLPSQTLLELGVPSGLMLFAEVSSLLAKALFIQAAFAIAGRSLPAVRANQAHDFAWRVLAPAALLALMGCRIFSGVGA